MVYTGLSAFAVIPYVETFLTSFFFFSFFNEKSNIQSDLFSYNQSIGARA